MKNYMQKSWDNVSVIILVWLGEVWEVRKSIKCSYYRPEVDM